MNRASKTVDYDAVAAQVLEEIAADFPEDLEDILDWLSRAASNKDAIQDLARYRWLPVGPREFILSPAYMDAADAMWPMVLDEFERMNCGKYSELVLTGAIGVAKTTLALYTQAYQLYIMSCLRNPHAEFDMDRSSEILIIFQSLNASLAKSVDYMRFRAMLSKAPYFQKQFPFDPGYESEMRFPNRIIVKPVSGQDTGAIGQNVIGGIIDEINFMAVVEDSKHSRDGGSYDQAIANYSSIARRRESRFMQLGELPGMLCLVSSRNYPGQFTDKKEEEARTNPRIYIYDKRLWEIRPERFCGDKFRIFTGDETRKPRVLEPGEIVPMEDQHMVMAIPTEYQSKFENDLLGMLRDVAGVSTMALHPFIINTNAIGACFGQVQSVLSREDVDFVASKLQIYPGRFENKYEPRFAHVDLAISKDSAGVSVGHVTGFKSVDRGDYTEMLPMIQMDFVLEIKPPKGGEIDFSKIRELLYAIRKIVPFKWVSFDQFQSKDSMQIMHQNGFSVGYQSVDTDMTAYEVLKQAIYDGRLQVPVHPKVRKELVSLEIDQKKGKVDHPPHGSKDVADALAGVVYGLTMRREIWQKHGVPLTKIPKAILEPRTVPKKSLSYMEKVRAERGVHTASPESYNADV
jgi:hypothetical protein